MARQAIVPAYPLTVYVNETSTKDTIAATVYINESQTSGSGAVVAASGMPKRRFTQVIWFDPYGY